jgi:hypothetical protein
MGLNNISNNFQFFLKKLRMIYMRYTFNLTMNFMKFVFIKVLLITYSPVLKFVRKINVNGKYGIIIIQLFYI